MTCLAQRAHACGRDADPVLVVLNLFRKSYDHLFYSVYGLPLGVGVGDAFGAGVNFRLLRIISHTGADFAISFSDPMIDICTRRSSTILKYESMPPGSPSMTARTLSPWASTPAIWVVAVARLGGIPARWTR